MKVKAIKKPDEAFQLKWEQFISNSTNGSVMQSPFAFRLFQSTYNFEPVLLCCFDEKMSITGILLGVIIRESKGIKGYFSSRVVIYGGPVLEDSHPDAVSILSLLIQKLVREVSRRSVFIQFRASWDLSGYENTFKEFGFVWSPRLNLLIDTRSQKRVLSEMSSSRIRQIKTAKKNGAKIIVPENRHQLIEFYNILSKLYREKIRKPLPDFSFFESFWNLTKNGENGKIFLVAYEGVIIGGIMSPFYPGKTVYEWYVCGLDEEFRRNGIYPSVLATWAAIEYALDNGFSQFDFMGVGKPDEPYGVRDFKKRFGGEMVNYGRFIRINNKFLYTVAELGYNFLMLFKKV